jgi:membrane protein required for colicin V production
MSFRGVLAPALPGEPPINNVLAMLILFVVTSLAVWIGFRFISEAIEKIKLKEFDRQVGAMFGLAKGVLYCVVITLFAATLLKGQREAIVSSKSGYYISRLLTKADPLLPDGVKDAIEPYVAELEDAENGRPSTSESEDAASLSKQVTDKLFDSAKNELTETFDRYRGKAEDTLNNAKSDVQQGIDNAQQSAEDDLDMVDIVPPRRRR